jgi:hypothetical protein
MSSVFNVAAVFPREMDGRPMPTSQRVGETKARLEALLGKGGKRMTYLDADRAGGAAARVSHDLIKLIVAALLFVAPWLLGYSQAGEAAYIAWISAAIIAAVSIAALVRFAKWEEWVNLALGVWLVLAPLLMHVSQIEMARISYVFAGVFVAVSAAWQLWAESGRNSPGL